MPAEMSRVQLTIEEELKLLSTEAADEPAPNFDGVLAADMELVPAKLFRAPVCGEPYALYTQGKYAEASAKLEASDGGGDGTDGAMRISRARRLFLAMAHSLPTYALGQRQRPPAGRERPRRAPAPAGIIR